MFKVVSTVSIHSTPSWSQLEEIKRFLANSLLLELKIIQISTEEARSGGGAQCRITLTIQVRNRHRAKKTARELGEWLQSALEGILVEEGLWKVGAGSPAPDTPRVFEVLGVPKEEKKRTQHWGRGIRRCVRERLQNSSVPTSRRSGRKRREGVFSLRPESIPPGTSLRGGRANGGAGSKTS